MPHTLYEQRNSQKHAHEAQNRNERGISMWENRNNIKSRIMPPTPTWKRKNRKKKSIKYTRSRTRSFTIASERTERKKVPQGHFDGKHAANQMEGEEKIDKNKKDGRKWSYIQPTISHKSFKRHKRCKGELLRWQAQRISIRKMWQVLLLISLKPQVGWFRGRWRRSMFVE